MKITSFSKDVQNISKLSDRPNIENGYTADSLKELFDKAGVDIKEYINTVLIEELTSTAEHSSGADRVGSGSIATVPGETVQEKLVSLSAQINELANGVIPDGSVTPDKFSPDIASFLTSASNRVDFFGGVGKSTFVVKRDGTYKFTLVGGGAGGGIQPSDISLRLGGGGGASAIFVAELSVGDLCEITVGEGGKGMQVDGYSFASSAKNGGDTTLSINGVTVATAGGGTFGLDVRGEATGGMINCSGGYPKAAGVYGSSPASIEFAIGGDSMLGNGAAYKNDKPGIGGGGFAGRFYSSGIYYKGYDGGDGCALAEYIK